MIDKKLLETLPHAIRVIRGLASECLDGTVTFQQLRVLFLVKEGLSTTQMAEGLQVSVAAISKMVNALVGRGLLGKKPGADRREQELNLTPEGKRILRHISSHLERRLNRSLETLSPAEAKELDQGLNLLKRLMETVHEK